jgi:hypothetical protein
MNDQRRVERPAPMCLEFDLGELLLGHAGVVLKAQSRNPIVAADISDQAYKAGDPADPMITGRKPIKLSAHVEILALYSDHRLSLQ